MPNPPDPNASAARLAPPWGVRALIVAAAFLPGCLAGIQLAGLLFFLNPHLPFTALTMTQGFGFYGALLGGASLLLTLPFTWDRPRQARRWLPSALTLVLAAAGLGAWIHASYFAFYLPPGMNRRLLKAAIWLSLAALICFYTVLLHRLRHRPYSRRSWSVFALMAIASIYVVVERREAFGTQVKASPRASTFEGSPRPLLCVVGIESATFDAILPLEERGHLPFFSKMLRDGAHARLHTLLPAHPDALWATLATGKYPYQHGVVGEHLYHAGFLRGGATLSLLPLGIGFEHWGVRGDARPIDSRALSARALWDILSQLGAPASLVGWPLTSPPPPGARSVVSDRFFTATDGEQPGEIYPLELLERARLFRTRPEEIDPATAGRFGSAPPEPVLAALARDLWIRDLGVFLLDQDPQIDALFIALPGLEEISHRYFGGFSAVQFEGRQDPELERAAQLIGAYYAQLDELLGELWELSREPRLLVVVSTRGAEGAKGWNAFARRLLRRPAAEGFVDRGADGVLLLLGAGIPPRAAVRSAELVDLVPTLLYGLGLPIARDLDGAVLTDAFETGFLARQPLTFVPSYESFSPPD